MGLFGGGSTPKVPKPPPPPEMPVSMASPDVMRTAMFSRVGKWSGFAGTRVASRPKKRNPALQVIIPGGNRVGSGREDKGNEPVLETGGTGAPPSLPTAPRGALPTEAPPSPRVVAADPGAYPQVSTSTRLPGEGSFGGPIVKPKKKKGNSHQGARPEAARVIPASAHSCKFLGLLQLKVFVVCAYFLSKGLTTKNV